MNRRVTAQPAIDPAAPPVSAPIPWSTPIVLLRVIEGSASTRNEQPVPSGTREAFRRPALRLVEPSVSDAPRPLTVLLIDDNHHHRIPLLRALRANRYDVLYAADGARGEELFRTSPHEIDAVVACAEMRRMSGFELARRVRRVRPEIAVLLMCSATRPEPDRGFELHDPVIEELFTPEQLTHRLAEVLAAIRGNECPE